MTSIRRTLSVPMSFLLCYIFISVADSYSCAAFNNALSRKCSVNKVVSMVYIRSHDMSLQRTRRESFVLHSSTKTSEVSSEKVSIKKFTKEIFQKLAVFCAIFIASISAAPRKALAAAAPLMKNIKVWMTTLCCTVEY